jgi:hypothetical protein
MRMPRSLSIVGLAALALVLPTTASAEGRFTSYLRGVGEDYESRVWEDRNTDNTNGFVYIGSCRDASNGRTLSSVVIDIARVRTGPDAQVKRGRTCDGASVFFGDVGSGKYYFEIEDIILAARMDADRVTVEY